MVEIIPKPAKKILPWQNILFYISLALLLVAVLSYFLLVNFESKSLAFLSELEEKIVAVGILEEKTQEAKIFAYNKKIKDFSILLEDHQKSSNFFQILEKITHPKAWFSKLELDLGTSKAVISGQTPNFQVLGQQLLIFQPRDLIEDVNLSNLSLGKKGEAEFTFNLSLAPEIFK